MTSALEGTWACPPGTVVADSNDPSDRTIELTCTVALPRDRVYALWTTGEGFAQWWVPDNKIELEVGGAMEFYFMSDAPEGVRGSDGCRVLSYLPQRMVSFTWNSPPTQPYTRPRHTHVVVMFEDDGEGTRITLSHLGWPGRDFETHHVEWSETFAYFESAWANVLQTFQNAVV